MKIKVATIEDTDQVVKIINDSELGHVYFNKDEARIHRLVAYEISKEQVLVVVDDEANCIAALNYDLRGAFHMHPYIHILVVCKQHKSKGIGKTLMRYFEQEIIEDASKIFLLAGKWNTHAIKFYESLGYSQLCEIDGFYTKNVKEILMLKDKGDA